MARTADGVIVGSAIIKVMEKYLGRPGLVKAAGAFAGRISKAVKG
jgi:tryptophan synthase alpha subunit